MTDSCNPLRGVCLMLNSMETHLMRRDFMSPELCAPLLPDDTPIQFIDSVDLKKTPYAHPVVSYTVGNIMIQRSNQGQLSSSGITDMSVTISVTVSTAVKALTRALSFELGSVLWALDNQLKRAQVYLQSTVIGEVQQNPENHCYESVIKIGAGLGKPVWKTSIIEGIVREVRLGMSSSSETTI